MFICVYLWIIYFFLLNISFSKGRLNNDENILTPFGTTKYTQLYGQALLYCYQIKMLKQKPKEWGLLKEFEVIKL